MHCKKCGGRVMHDRMYNTSVTKKKGDKEERVESSHLELSCVRCGKRWAVKKGSNAFAKWLEKLEKQRDGAFGISS